MNGSIKRILFAGISALFAISGLAQNAPLTTAATIGGVTTGTVSVPVTVTGFTGIGAVSLSIDYLYSVMQFTGSTPNPALPSFPCGDLDLGTGYHRLTMSWFGSSATLPAGATLITLHFSFTGGISTLDWYDNGPSCEYTDAAYNVLNDIPQEDYYINGLVCGVLAAPGPVTGPAALCQGTPQVSYSISPVTNATGYEWTVPQGCSIIAGQNTNAILVEFSTAAQSGNITVVPVNGCGQGTSSGLFVLVSPLPAADAGPDFTIPYGTSTTLSAAAGGTGNYAYHWSPEELLVDPNLQNPQTVIMTATTVFTLTVTDQASGCENSDQVVLTIVGGPLSAYPLAIPSALCQGGAAQLYSNVGGGSGNYLYLWTSDPPGSPPWSSTLPNPEVSPDVSTTYFLEVYDGFSTINAATQLVVAELPEAEISGGDTLCGLNVYTELRVDLTGLPPWNFTYSFGNTSVFVTNVAASPYFITASDPGDYILTSVEDFNCSGTTSGVAIVRKYPVPAQPAITINGYELISSSCCGNQWYLDGQPIPGAVGQTHQAVLSGEYTVIVTLNTCSSPASDPVNITVGIRELSSRSIFIHPNPAHDRFVVELPCNCSEEKTFEVISSTGVKTGMITVGGNPGEGSFDASGMAPGLYFLRGFCEGDFYSGKLCIF